MNRIVDDSTRGRHTLRVIHTHTTALTAALLLGIAPAPVVAQGSTQPTATTDRTAPRLTCWRGRPLPACTRFVITELGYLRQIATTRTPITNPDGTLLDSRGDDDFGGLLYIDVGMMQNVSARTALGATLTLGSGLYGDRTALTGRYRRWLDTSGVALELSAGLAQVSTPTARRAVVATSGLALNFSDYGALIARADLGRMNGHTARGIAVGARLGTKPAVIGSGVLAIAFGLLALAFSGGDF